MSRLTRLHKFCLVIFLALNALFMTSPAVLAQQQNIQPLLDRIERLERDIRTLNVQLARKGGGKPVPLASATETIATSTSRPAVARMGARMDALEADLRAATGSIESANHQVFQLKERLDKLVSDIDFRLSSIEARLGQGAASGAGGQPMVSAAPSPAPVQSLTGKPGVQSLGTVSVSEIDKISQQTGESVRTAGVPPQTAAPAAPGQSLLPEGSVKERYDYAITLLRQQKFDQAEPAFKAFIEAHGDDKLAGNARYWLGETYYVRRSYQEAAQAFFDGFTKDPNGAKAADSLLKLGMSLAGLEKGEEACAAFSKVLSDYPNAPARIKNAVASERTRNNCS